jgi:hypothetical protein
MSMHRRLVRVLTSSSTGFPATFCNVREIESRFVVRRGPALRARSRSMRATTDSVASKASVALTGEEAPHGRSFRDAGVPAQAVNVGVLGSGAADVVDPEALLPVGGGGQTAERANRMSAGADGHVTGLQPG